MQNGFGTGKKNDNKNHRNRFICAGADSANNDLAQIVDTNDEWIRSRTGIGERRIATTESTSYMAAKAAMGALEQSGLKPGRLTLSFLGLPHRIIVSKRGVRGAGHDWRGQCGLL